MKIRTRREDGPKPEAWFLRELALLSKDLYPKWNWRRQVWEIVKNVPKSVFRKGILTEYLVAKGGRFAPLDRRVIEAIRRALYEKQRMVSLDHFLQAIDREEEEKQRRALALRQDGMRHLMKKVYEKEKTISVFIHRNEGDSIHA